MSLEILEETDAKIDEAKFFLQKINEYYQGDDKEFEYIFNAFLNSWSGIFDVILEDYQHIFHLKISNLEDVNPRTFRKKAIENKTATKFIDWYDNEFILLFGSRDHEKIISKLSASQWSFAKLISEILNQTNWKTLNYDYEDCYTALYDVISDIIGWNIPLFRLCTNPIIIQKAYSSKFDEEFVLQFCDQVKLKDANLTLEKIFSQEFLKQQVIRKQSERLGIYTEGITELKEKIQSHTIKTPVLTLTGAMRQKRNLKTHRSGSGELLGPMEHFSDGKPTHKTRHITFLIENYVNEEQVMSFGHSNLPLDTLEICESIFSKARQFVAKVKQEFPPSVLESKAEK